LRAGEAPISIQMLLDKKPVPLDPQPVEVSASVRQVTFLVSKDQSLKGTNTRSRLRLEGYDKDWYVRVGMMTTIVRFFNRNGDQVGETTFRHVRKNPSWDPELGDSAFDHMHETFVVPPEADHLVIILSSGNGAGVIGIFAVKNLVLQRKLPDGTEEPLVDTRPAGTDASAAQSLGWVPDGTHASMARMGGGDPARREFLIVDEDVSAHADWRTEFPGAPKVTPGETLTLDWDVAFNCSTEDAATFNYVGLQPGRYRLVLEDMDTFGRLLDSGRAVEFVVQAPFWKTSSFAVLATIAVTGAGALVFRGRSRARVKRQIERTELVAAERLRIARDLHDDLGARLSHISLVSSAADEIGDLDEARQNLRSVSEMTRELMLALSENVWTLNPKNDHLESLVGFLCRTTTTACQLASISCRTHIPAVTEDIPVDYETRHHIALIVKEAVNNAIRHAQATELRLEIACERSVLKISVTDNGQGNIDSSTPRGNGLLNMKQRVELIGGDLSVSSTPEAGTTISFEAPLRYIPEPPVS
jgi:signal transduction histidine kinase